jgi:hypothetical protein
MNDQTTSQDGAAREISCVQSAARTGKVERQSADDAAYGDAYAITQAARSVMHPEWHDFEWRFYHSAAHG